MNRFLYFKEYLEQYLINIADRGNEVLKKDSASNRNEVVQRMIDEAQRAQGCLNEIENEFKKAHLLAVAEFLILLGTLVFWWFK